jgi:putative adhesin
MVNLAGQRVEGRGQIKTRRLSAIIPQLSALIPLLSALFPLLSALTVFSACDLAAGHLMGRATEEWTRSYPLGADGEIRIVNTNGKVEVEGVDGSTVEVRAEKIARAATDAGAQELLPRIGIKEDVQPNRVSLETERMNGIMIGAAFEVRYHVRAPKRAVVNVTTTNGGIALTALGGKIVAHTTNGGVNAKDMAGAIEARSTNGGVTLDMASFGSDPISARTTNGGVVLLLPASARADVSASCTNGGIIVSPELKLDVNEQSRRSLQARMNGGGAPITLSTTNGGVRIKPRGMAERETTDGDDRDVRRLDKRR